MHLSIVILIILIQKASLFNYETSKIILHKPSFSTNTYFGFTVAGYKIENDSWILIGAPLTMRERPHIHSKSREGAVFRCRINVPNSCYMLPFDKKEDWSEARDHYGIYYNENKTDQLLGATLQVTEDIIMACAPNYRHVSRVLRQDEFRQEPTGICYILKDKMRKFEEHSPCRNSMWGHHRQGYCQAGFSGAISKNDSSLYISGPGAWYWQGMIFSINLFNKDIKNRYPDKSGEGNQDDSYRGYSIDIGHFDNDIYEDIVVSAPRGNNCKGLVEIFSSNLKILHIIYGYQIGAYFGGSVIAVDLNNDRSEDIIVGSPMFKRDTENYDIGRIDIYIRDKKSKGYVFKNLQINGFKSKSRFGNTLAKIGDSNDDGFNDIAVGAPYDGEEESGIVYIYRGSSEGLNTIPDQIIKGSDYKLNSFGYSISGGLDLDGNQYPDLIVGAYKSDAVVYIRSRAVIKTNISTQTIPKVIDFDSRNSNCERTKNRFCMDLEFCVQYFGKEIPNIIKMSISIELDVDKYQNESSIRAFFANTNSPFYKQNYTFSYDQKKCFKQTINIKKNIRDKLAPIKCRLNITLPKHDSDWELMPLFNNKEEISKIHEIRFLRNCGSDDICTPDLCVSATTPSKKYIYGSRYNIDLNIKIENKKEDAFEAQCHVILPYGVDYVKAFISQNINAPQQSLHCSHSKLQSLQNETKIICDIGNPLVGGSMKIFTIRVAPLNILLEEDVLKFNITVISSNKEEKKTVFDNENFVYVNLDASPDVTLIGKQYQEQIIYEMNTGEIVQPSNETEIGPEIMHEFKIINNGPSQITLTELLISWQKQKNIAHKQKDFLYLVENPYTEGPIKCDIESSLINPLNLSYVSGDKMKNPEIYYNKEINKNRKIRELSEETILDSIECSTGMIKKPLKSNENNKNTFKYLSMIDSHAYNFFCGSLHCNVGPLKADESALIRIRFRLWSKNLAIDPEVYQIKTFAMTAVTQIPYSKLNLNLDQFQSLVQLETIAYPKERKNIFHQLDMNIVFLSVVAGIILLLLMIIILWCCGFFKRFEPQEMKKLSELTISEEEISNDVIDMSKDCGKLDTNEEMDLLSNKDNSVHNSNKINYQYKTPKRFSPNNDYDETVLINSGKANTSCNLNDENNKINQHFKNASLKNSKRLASNELVIYSSPKVDIKTNSVNFQEENNLTAETLFYGSNDLTKTNNLNFSTFQASNSIQQSKPIYSTISNKSSQKALINQSSNNSDINSYKNTLLNNSSLALSASIPKIDNFTSKLPPVPRRNSKTQINLNSNLNLNSMPKQQNASLKYVGASNSNLSFSVPITGLTFDNSSYINKKERINNSGDEYYQSIDINNSMTKSMTNQPHKNINNSDEFEKTSHSNMNSNYYQKI